MHEYDPFCCCPDCCEQAAVLDDRIRAEERARREKRRAYAPEPELQLAVHTPPSRCR